MSAGEFIKDAGGTLVALAGLGVAYANTRQPAREARHHARVETLYQDMLDTLQRRVNELRERAGLGEVHTLPVQDSTNLVTRARIRLYASGPITVSWDRVHSDLRTLEDEQSENRLNLTVLHLRAIESEIAELAELMRRDLRVPGVPLRTRTRTTIRNRWHIVSGGRRRAIRAARSEQSDG